MDEVAINVENISLKYRFVKNVKMKQVIASFITRQKMGGRIREIQALKNVSFQVKKGSTCGVIGSNGAGKSTLLKLLAGLFEPDGGTITLNTESVSLLSLGVGFVSELSGIDNIYISCLLLGMTKKEVDAKLNDIIEYSGIGDFVYEPIKSYSSGMKSRLSFSTSIMMNPDILLIDEILGVGDQDFKKKSGDKIKEMISQNRTVVLVSHDMNTISSLCDTVLWLEHGEVIKFGPAEETVEDYLQYVRETKRMKLNNIVK